MSVLTHTSLLYPRHFIGPTSSSLGQVGSVIDVTVLGLTIIGSTGVLISLLIREFKSRSSTVRTRLLMFLVFSDLFMGVIGILSPSYYLLTGRGPSARSCSTIGFLLLTSIWTQYINAIVLCIATYIILLHPLSRYVRHLQQDWMWLPPIMWGISLLAAGICWRVTGFSFNSGFCYISDKKGPEFFADYYALCPRAVVFFVVVILYGHLFYFLRRPDKLDYLGSSQSQSDEIRSRPLGLSIDPEPVSSRADRSKESRGSKAWWKQGSRLGRRVGTERGTHSNNAPRTPRTPHTPQMPPKSQKVLARESQEIELQADLSSFALSTYDSRKVSRPAPWENIDLSIPETIPTAGGPEPIRPCRKDSAYSDPSTLVHKHSSAAFSSTNPVQHRPSVSSSEQSYIHLHSIHQSIESVHPSSSSKPIASVGSSDSIPLGQPIMSQASSRSSDSSPSRPPALPSSLPLPAPLPIVNSSGEPVEFLSTSSPLYPPQTTHSSRSPFSSPSSPEHSSPSSSLTSLHYTISTVDSLSAPPLGHYIPAAFTHPARRPTVKETPTTKSAETELGTYRNRADRTDEEVDKDHVLDFKDMLDDPVPFGSQLTAGQSGENQESISSFMNRKASLLMILFPIAYVVLFTLSLARIITDLVHPYPIPILSGFSRWGIFASGIVDAILYGLVEWKIKRDVRKMTKKSRQEGIMSDLG